MSEQSAASVCETPSASVPSTAPVLCTYHKKLGVYSVECKLVALNGQFIFHRKRSIGTKCFDINNTVITSSNLVKQSKNTYVLYIDEVEHSIRPIPHVFTLNGTMHDFASCFDAIVYGCLLSNI